MMATSGLNSIRVRLYFDYPPPAVPDCRMCWVLVDLNKCRVVADLASIIKEKFDFSRRTIINLFIEDCYLPPAESVYVVRDNDSIRVKVEGVSQVNGFESTRNLEKLSWKAKKRHREVDEDVAENEEHKVKKNKVDGQGVESQPAREEKKKKKKKKKKKLDSSVSKKPEVPVKQIAVSKTPTPSKPRQDQPARKPSAPATSAQSKAARQSTSSSGTSDSSEEEPPKKATAVSAPSRPGGGGLAKAVAPPPAAAAGAASSSDSSSDSSPSPAPPPKKPLPAVSAPPAPLVAKGAQAKLVSSSSDSDSSSEPELVIKRPGLGQRAGLGVAASSNQLGGVTGRGGENSRGGGRGGSPGQGVGRGIGRGDGRPPWRGGGPRGGPRGGHGRARGGVANQSFHFNYQNGLQQQQQQQQQHLSDVLTNKAVVLQNPPENVPKRDYTTMPLLAGPPQVGQKIAFKLLELTENYTPEVSDYKEGKIVSFNPSTNQVELELLTSKPAPLEPGKFDLVYQSADGSEIVEYAVSRGSQLTERWESLLEPRLILENVA